MKNCLVLAGSYKNAGILTKQAWIELNLWLPTLTQVNGRTSKPTHAKGAKSENVKIVGAWNSKELTLHINCLELLAAFKLVCNTSLCSSKNKSNYPSLDGQPVSGIAYGNHMGTGETHSNSLADLAIQFCNWVLHLSSGKAHCRKRECVSRSDVSFPSRSYRLDAEVGSVQQHQSAEHGGVLEIYLATRLSAQLVTPEILQLETRASS